MFLTIFCDSIELFFSQSFRKSFDNFMIFLKEHFYFLYDSIFSVKLSYLFWKFMKILFCFVIPHLPGEGC